MTSYVANPTVSTTGWTLASLYGGGATLTTVLHLPGHEWDDRAERLVWP